MARARPGGTCAVDGAFYRRESGRVLRTFPASGRILTSSPAIPRFFRSPAKSRGDFPAEAAPADRTEQLTAGGTWQVKKMARLSEAKEVDRLTQIYSALPPNEFAVAQGLIYQAARLRCQLDVLYADIKKNGITELFQQSDKVEPYTRIRPEYDAFIRADKNYQAIIRQMNEMTPASTGKSKLAELLDDDK